MYKCELRKVILTDDEIFDTTIQHFVESFDVEILFYKLMIWYAKKWISNGFLFFFFFSFQEIKAEYIYCLELYEFYSVFQFLFFVEMLQLIDIRTF